jgi:hypothetical protein
MLRLKDGGYFDLDQMVMSPCENPVSEETGIAFFGWIRGRIYENI